MTEIDWFEMVHYQQVMQKFSRMLLSTKHQVLTPSECELLAWLYFNPENNTSLLLSKKSGMKKEAVSRCLKSLYERGCIRKEKHPTDERSYMLFITEKGLAELKLGYENILKPFYDLRDKMGPEFKQLFELICKMVNQIEEDKRRKIKI